jgi:hypothetical protein
MLRKFVVAMIATTMLAAPALAAEKPAAATPAAPPGSAAAPSASTASKTDAGTPPANVVKAAVPHRRHSHHWYMVHRGRHPGHTLASKGSTPVKHVDVHRPHEKTGQQLVKTNKDASGKATQ